MDIERARHTRVDRERCDTGDQTPASSGPGESAPDTIVMRPAVDEHGKWVRVVCLMPRRRISSDGFTVIEGLPKWFTEHGDRMSLLCDSHFEVVRTQQRLRLV